MKAGAVDFLPKPFKPKELLVSVERALSRSGRTTPARSGEESCPATYSTG